jgi:hypothetical protein
VLRHAHVAVGAAGGRQTRHKKHETETKQPKNPEPNNHETKTDPHAREELRRVEARAHVAVGAAGARQARPKKHETETKEHDTETKLTRNRY